MAIWSSESNALAKLSKTIADNLPKLTKEVEPLIKSNDANVVLLYARRSLEVIVTELCETELKRPRKTEPLKGIIDKLNSEDKVPSYIITSMHSLNSLATFGTHPKDFDPEQVKPVLNNLSIVIKWYLNFKGIEISLLPQSENILSTEEGANSDKSDLSKLEKSVAILPFRNDSPGEENTYFINGVMEEILNNLQKIRDIRVISRTSVELYRNQTKSIPEIAKELGVNYIVEGSAQRYGSNFRLRTQLIMAAKENHLWGESFQKQLNETEDIFGIQIQIAESIAAELKAIITPEEKKLIEKLPTDNLEAYEAYLRGQFYLNKFTPDSLDSAMGYFEKAKQIDPNYALAYTGICDVWSYRQQWGLVVPAEGNPKSMESLMKAYALDSNNAVVQYTLAGKKTFGMFDWDGGEKGFMKSISLNPNSAMTHAVYSHLLSILGRTDEALQQIDIALKLDPMNPFILVFYGADLSIARKHDDALKAINDALDLEPGYLFAIVNSWHIAYAGGYTEVAYNALKSFWNMVDPEAVKSLEEGYLKNSFDGAFLSLANRLGEIWITNQNQLFAPSDIACLYSAGHETDKSIIWIEKAYNFKDPNIPYLLLPIYDNVRSDPHFQNLCHRMKLPWKY